MIIDKRKIDKRNYNVSFDKIKKILNYTTEYNVKYGVEEIRKAVENGKFSDYADNKYSNYKFLQNSGLE